jgi:hypothetical protein
MPALAVALSKVYVGLPDVGIVHDVDDVKVGAPVYSFVWLKLANEKKVVKIKTNGINKKIVVPVRAVACCMVFQDFKALNYL